MIVKKHLCINICVYTHIHPHVYIFKNSLEVELLDQRFLFQIVSSLANFLQKRLYHLPLTVPVTLHSFQVLLLLIFLKFAYQMSENILTLFKASLLSNKVDHLHTFVYLYFLFCGLPSGILRQLFDDLTFLLPVYRCSLYALIINLLSVKCVI